MRVHVAGLYREPFALVLKRRKRLEYRRRARPDRAIEAIESGTVIIFREERSARAVRVTAAGVARRGREGEMYLYEIPLSNDARLINVTGPREQGWRVRELRERGDVFEIVVP